MIAVETRVRKPWDETGTLCCDPVVDNLCVGSPHCLYDWFYWNLLTRTMVELQKPILEQLFAMLARRIPPNENSIHKTGETCLFFLAGGFVERLSKAVRKCENKTRQLIQGLRSPIRCI